MGNLGNRGKNWGKPGIFGLTKSVKIFFRGNKAQQGTVGQSGAEWGVANSGAERRGCPVTWILIIHMNLSETMRAAIVIFETSFNISIRRGCIIWFILATRMQKILINFHPIEGVLNTYWAKPSPLFKNSMLPWSILGDGEAGAQSWERKYTIFGQWTRLCPNKCFSVTFHFFDM